MRMKSSKVFPELVTKHSRSFEWNKRAIPERKRKKKERKKKEAMDIFEEKSLVAPIQSRAAKLFLDELDGLKKQNWRGRRPDYGQW